MSKYVTQVTHLDNGNSFEYVNYNGTWFKYGKNIQNEGWKYKEMEEVGMKNMMLPEELGEAAEKLQSRF